MDHKVWLIASIAATLLVAGECRDAHACSIGVPGEYKIDENEKAVDSTPPEAPMITGYHVLRSHHDDKVGCSADNCPHLGWIYIDVGPTQDDRTPPDKMGYQIELGPQANDEIEALFLSDTPKEQYEPGQIVTYWNDENSAGQGPVDATLYIWSVDLAGNKSLEPAIVTVLDPGRSGCAVGGNGEGVLLMIFIVLAWTSRRRR